ncbi:protein N-terminal asparagine amidohydrolase-like isoform X1 [Coffea arabica]|uniref:Protein N-terminal asparagine amidohydrolase-like isoform X1 n=1 Tax=Coffea arabica TaxID=13443 RepID=A0ABM4WWX7_COFAR
MIYVGGVPFQSDGPSSSEGSKILLALMEHPTLVSASCSFKSTPERKFSASEDSGLQRGTGCKWVYVFQREYATVDPALVDLVGTDEATTCVGLAIRNHKSGMTSVGHLDSPDVVETGLTQMLSLVVDQNSDEMLEVHLVGGYNDSSPQGMDSVISNHTDHSGFSFPLCAKIVETLEKSDMVFHLQTLHVLENNTKQDSEGNAYPIFNGFMVEPSTGSIFPANFDRTSRCPDEVVRRIRLSSSYEDPSWNGRLLETYDIPTDRFVIAPCAWTIRQLQIAMMLQNLSDAQILLTCSTSPSVEAPDFVENERRQWDYLKKHPDWKETFPMKQPRIFERTPSGRWKRSPVARADAESKLCTTE